MFYQNHGYNTSVVIKKKKWFERERGVKFLKYFPSAYKINY